MHSDSHEALVALDRAHPIHPVSAWRTHEQRGPTARSAGGGGFLRCRYKEEARAVLPQAACPGIDTIAVA